MDPLERIEHIVVLQLENRSFDHMLGYLALPEHRLDPHPGELDAAVNGLRAGLGNEYEGVRYEPARLDEPVFDRHDLDPPHDADEVARQIAGGEMSGFVEAWAEKLIAKEVGRGPMGWLKRLIAGIRRRPPARPDPDRLRAVMSHVTPDQVPVFDHVARHFALCDNWFCGVPGPTMPNRFFSVAGTHGGVMSNVRLLTRENGRFASLFRRLRNQSMWRWYSSDPAILRAIDEDYRFDVDEGLDHFAYFDEGTEVQPRTFLGDVLKERSLPEVAWIDPNFAIADMMPLGELLDTPGSNDDHPPSPLVEAQRLVAKVYEALGRSPYWDDTLLVVYYDEHGGFFDHEPPPEGRGPRIPVLVVGGRVKRGVCHEELDHASLIKTILLRFGQEGAVDEMPARVGDANDLRPLLRDDDAVVPFAPIPAEVQTVIGPVDLEPRRLPQGAARATRVVELMDRALTDLQELIVRYHALSLRTGRRWLRFLAKPLAKRLGKLPPSAEHLPRRRP
jgi:phospholipase C